MLAPSETIAARAVLFAVEDFMSAARRVTRRSLHNGTKLDSVRYQIRKKEFARAKEVLINAIDQINLDSDLGRNIEKLFNMPGFVKSAESALATLQGKIAPTTLPGNADAVKMSGLSRESDIFTYETEILRRFNFDENWISQLTRQSDSRE